ncbi:rRNA maturation RNase YbeY [Aliicoccus persicus]|uniref:Endoribonuclease YbeY n=1 Tax=Aliicoccus persicus TaxID=930138 RepID=A0A662Z2L7_9STAP|nr:rRNA maturation RNase YbeY [Aliicoccus persicus]SEV85076.1 probable rRNA maturation factor [Aliicoccus persicus]
MLTIDFIDDRSVLDDDIKTSTEALLQFAYTYLKQEEEAELSVSYVTNEEIQKINRDYRNKDEVTDVISFAMEDGDDEIDVEGAERVLGDIIIADDVARNQAAEYGHSNKREYLFLALHGFLHLMGYDHIEKDEEVEMNRLQDDILNEFGISRDA